MKKIQKKINEFFLLKVFGRNRISEIANMYEVSSSIKILENDYGHILSIKEQLPVDLNKEPLPWYTYPAIEFLKQFDLRDKLVFEWGCGNSSLFFAKRVSAIKSVEDNEEWFNNIYKSKRANQEIKLAKDLEYINYISHLGYKFDVIIIDGKHRSECAKIAYNFLNEGGFIILDNSDWHKNSAKYIRELGLIQVDFHGFGPINQYTWTTSFFLHPKFNFKAYNDIQPSNPIGGLNQVCD